MKYPNDFINKVIQGDCLEIMKHIPDKSIDIAITSPPYNYGISNWPVRGKWTQRHLSFVASVLLYTIFQ